MAKEITTANFETEVLKSEKPVLPSKLQKE